MALVLSWLIRSEAESWTYCEVVPGANVEASLERLENPRNSALGALRPLQSPIISSWCSPYVPVICCVQQCDFVSNRLWDVRIELDVYKACHQSISFFAALAPHFQSKAENKALSMVFAKWKMCLLRCPGDGDELNSTCIVYSICILYSICIIIVYKYIERYNTYIYNIHCVSS